MITRFDDGQDFDPDDPLTVILRPTPGHLGLPPGRYEKIRRGAARRRLLRIAVGVGLSGAVATLVALPLRPAGPESPASPTGPLGPPPVSSPSTGPTSSLTPTPTPTPTPPPTTIRPTAKSRPTRQVPARPAATQVVPSTDVPLKAPRTAPPSQSGEQPSARPTRLER